MSSSLKGIETNIFPGNKSPNSSGPKGGYCCLSFPGKRFACSRGKFLHHSLFSSETSDWRRVDENLSCSQSTSYCQFVTLSESLVVRIRLKPHWFHNKKQPKSFRFTGFLISSSLSLITLRKNGCSNQPAASKFTSHQQQQE